MDAGEMNSHTLQPGGRVGSFTIENWLVLLDCLLNMREFCLFVFVDRLKFLPRILELERCRLVFPDPVA